MAQIRLRGQVLASNGESLPFVNIIINENGRLGTTTDIDGRFILEGTDSLQHLRFSYIGYRDLLLRMDTVDTRPPWRVMLQARSYDFNPVEVVAGPNPADVIMRRVIRNRHRNDPEKLERYRCRTYNKVILSWLPEGEAYGNNRLNRQSGERDTLQINGRQRQILRLMEDAQQHHLFMMETLTERRFRQPGAYSETVLANRASGFTEAPFAALANDVQPFSFYEEEVFLLDKPFLNPVSPNSPKRYFFQLEDTLYQPPDTVFLIRFHPREGKNFNGLKGTLSINSHRYAVQNIIAEPADTGLLHFRIEQLYDRPDSLQWFPAQLNYEIRMPKYPSPHLGLQIQGKSYIREATLDVILEDTLFNRKDRFDFLDSAHMVAEDRWQANRPQPLDTLETRTYELIDSLGEVHHFDRWLDRLEALGRGRWPLGPTDLILGRLVQFNQYEDIRLGLGLYTGKTLASWFTVGGYAGYGIQDRRWKYGAEIKFFSDWDHSWEWSWYYRKDLKEAGGTLFPLSNHLVSRRLFADRMDREESYGFFLQAEPVRYLQMGLEVSHTRLTPLYAYAFRLGIATEADREYRFSEAALHLHYAYGQQYRRILGMRTPAGKAGAYPAFSLSLRRGFGKAWKGEYPYWQVWMALDHRFRLLHLGETIYRLEGGRTFGSVPVSRLYGSVGAGRNAQWLMLGQVFQTMEPYEFLSDRYFSIFFRQELGQPFYRSKWSQPAISLEHNFTTGTLSNPEQHEGIAFKTLEKGYMEAGVIVDNIIRLNYLNVAYLGLGGGMYYRYGAYHLPGGFGQNTGFRLSLAFDF